MYSVVDHKLRRNNSLSKLRKFLFTKFQGWWNPNSMTNIKTGNILHHCLLNRSWKTLLAAALCLNASIKQFWTYLVRPKFNFVNCSTLVLQWMIKRPAKFDYFFVNNTRHKNTRTQMHPSQAHFLDENWSTKVFSEIRYQVKLFSRHTFRNLYKFVLDLPHVSFLVYDSLF